MSRVCVIIIVAILAGAAHGLDSAGGLPFANQSIVYLIDGYLDRAPDAQQVQEDVEVGADGRNRLLRLVSYQRIGQGDPWILTRDLHAYHPDFLLIGAPDGIARILNAAPGSHVHGRFQYLRGPHCLVVDVRALIVE